MKKIIILALLLSSINILSQDKVHYKTNDWNMWTYDGTRTQWCFFIGVFAADTSEFGNSYYISPSNASVAYRFIHTGSIIVKDNDMFTGKDFVLENSSQLNNLFVRSKDSTYMPYVDNNNGYMTVSAATTTISAMTTSINTKAESANVYSKTDSDARYLQSFTEVDGSSTNELQTLSINSNSISLSNGGGTVVVPAQTTQTLTGSNGITISSAANTFTISKTKRQETYSVSTNSLGVATGTFSTTYSVAPNIQANIVGGTSNQIITMTVSATGFTVTVVQRNSVTLLATEVLLASTVNVNGASVDVLITEK